MKIRKYHTGIMMNGSTLGAATLSMRNGLWHFEDYVETVLTNAGRQTGFKKHRIVVGLRHDKTIMKSLKLDARLRPAEVYQYLQHHAETFFHKKASELHIDYEILNHDAANFVNHINAVAARREDVAHLIHQCKSIGVQASIIDTEALALLRATTLCRTQRQNDFCIIVSIFTNKVLFIIKNDKQVSAHQELDVESFNNAAHLLNALHRLKQLHLPNDKDYITQYWLIGGNKDWIPSIQSQFSRPITTAEFDTRLISTSSYSLDNPSALLMTCIGLAARI